MYSLVDFKSNNYQYYSSVLCLLHSYFTLSHTMQVILL